MATSHPVVLIVTHNDTVARWLEVHLPGHGYDIAMVRSVEQATAAIQARGPALVVADRTTPRLEQVRHAAQRQALPVLLLQPLDLPCRDEECAADLQDGIDMVVCAGSYREVVARIRSLLRRQQFAERTRSQYHCGPIAMDLDRHEVTVHGRHVELTPKEFRILRHLLASPNQVFSRQTLLNRVWGEDYALEEHALDVHISSLRRKIEEDPGRPRYIRTVRGIGYKAQAE